LAVLLKGFIAGSSIVLQTASKATARRRDHLTLTICYRATSRKSTRGLLASILAVCFALIAAPNLALARAERTLPAGALRNSPSLYLREAAESPIRWQPWGESSFELARTLKRPVLIDIGAVWCHWCHVMDQTTYSDPEVIRLINDNYVPIKIDTDERPDIDNYYQNAAEHLTGAGGWPLTCFTTDDGALMFAAGYIPPRANTGSNEIDIDERSAMVPLLTRISQIYSTEAQPLQRQADALAAKLRYDAAAPEANGEGSEQMLTNLLAELKRDYDSKTGGFGGDSGPRFFDFPAIRLALAEGFYGHPEFTSIALDSLKKIAAGGVFDQLGGGFHRYATDANWNLPHFEKLAYDQAMALTAYAEAYQQSRDDDFARVLRATIHYIDENLVDPQYHAFYSHQDADAFKGDDGSYYTWTVAEMKRTLDAHDAEAAFALYGVDNQPAHAPDGRIILRRAMTTADLAKRLKITPDQAAQLIDAVNAKLLAARERRQTPPVDRAIMTDRNALMVIGYLDAGDALGDTALRQHALAALDFILTHLRARDGSYFHVWADGRASVAGLAADQAYLLAALVDAYQDSGDERYRHDALKLSTVISTIFRASGSGLLVNRDPAEQGTVLAETIEDRSALFDLPTPSIQATAALAMRKLALLSGDDSLSKSADRLMASAPAMAGTSISTAIATVGLALEQRTHGVAGVAVIGNQSDPQGLSLWNAALATYRPSKVTMRFNAGQTGAGFPAAAQTIFAASANARSPIGFICAGSDCSHPASDGDQLSDLIKTFAVSGGPENKFASAGAAASH
jgi:uncharacterized protein